MKYRISSVDPIEITSTAVTLTVPLLLPAATTSIPSLRIPHGAAPSSPTNGDMWLTTAGLFLRVNGATYGPYAALNTLVTGFAAAAGVPSASDTLLQMLQKLAGNNVITSTTAALEAIGNAINTANKVTGRMVFNTTTNSPAWSVGATAGSVWVDATGATVHTPV
jgi:hypothetical protein